MFHEYSDFGLGKYWENIPGELKQISYGDSGLWGCNSKHQVYYRYGTRKGEGEAGLYLNMFSLHTHTHTHTHTHAHTHTHTHTRIRMHAHAHSHAHVHTQTYH